MNATMLSPLCFATVPAGSFTGVSVQPVGHRNACRRTAFRTRMTAAPAQTTIPTSTRETSAVTAISALRDVSYSVSGVSVVEGVNLDLHDGEIVAILGPSGSGKRYAR